MQFDLRGGTGATMLSAMVAFGFLITSVNPALATSPTKKHPKGFVHDTAGDGAPAPVTSAPYRPGTPKWVQYDAGGLYYYQHDQVEKARQYWMEALKEAEFAVPHERITGLKPETVDACCKLVHHLLYFINDVKFKKGYDARHSGRMISANSTSTNSSASTNNSLQYNLDEIKDNLRQMMRDWDWYERVCGFADRAIGKQRDCMREIYAQRKIFERTIVITRRSGQQIEKRMGKDLRYSEIDTRPLKWGGIEGAGNPFDTPGSDPTPLKYRGGALPEVVGPP